MTPENRRSPREKGSVRSAAAAKPRRPEGTSTNRQFAAFEASVRLEAASRVLVHDVMERGCVDGETALWASTMVDTAARFLAQVAA